MKPMLWNPSVADYLRTLGASERVIAFIDGQSDKQLQSKLANEVRKKPDIAHAELVAFVEALPKRRERDEWEKGLTRLNSVNSEVVNRWFARQLFKLRTGKMFVTGRPAERLAHVHDFSIARDPRAELLGQGPLRGGDPLPPPETREQVEKNVYKWNIHKLLSALADWVRATGTHLENYTWEEAINESDAWHEQVAAAGGGTVYEPQDPELITYQFADGWKLVAVMSENDLDVEGNLMKHCVGSYADRVAEGESRILSLRDPQNKPHVTAEFDKNWMLQQVQGIANSEPKDEYRRRLKEAFAAMLKAGMPLTTDEDYWRNVENAISEYDARGMVALLESAAADEYGLPGEPLDQQIFGDLVKEAADSLFDRNQDYYSSMRPVARALGDMAFEADWARGSIQVHVQRGDPVRFSYFDEKESILPVIYKILDADNEFFQNNNYFDEPMPDQDDYNYKEEFEKDLEAWQEREREYYDSVMKEGSFGFHGDIFKAYKAAAEKAGVVFER